MASQQGLATIETFLTVAEMVAQQLRIRAEDRWSANICQLKYVSFCSEFPEVNDQQLFWAAEKWLQSTADRDFLRYPTWVELMSPLYRCENGLANRCWGFKEELPPLVQPTYQQLQMLPPRPAPLKALPAAEPAAGPGLTRRAWAEYIKTLTEHDDGT
jgi:hypothetical protein